MNRFSTGLLLALTLAGPLAAAELRRGPYLQVPRPDGVTIRWRTDAAVRHTAVVRYGTDPDKLDKAVAAKEATTHFPGVRDWEATIDGLAPDAKYYYAVEADRATLCGADERHWFRTAPPIGQPRKLRFWCLGDSGSNRPRDDDKAKVLAATGPMDPIRVRNGFRKFNAGRPLDGVVLLGDNAYPLGTDEQYQAALFNVYADELCHTPLWPCTGNHDMDDAYRHLFTVNADAKAGGTKSASPFYYSADIAHLHLVVLDPWKQWLEVTTDEGHVPWKKQLDWLEKDLAATRQAWRLVVQHFPLYCDGNYDSDDNKPLELLRRRLVPLFDKHGVDVSLSGHDHTYQRSYLLRGLTGKRDAFEPGRHRVSAADGKAEPIVKAAGPDGGVVYVVSGTAGGSRPAGKFAHPALVPLDGEKRGLGVPSSLLIEIDGDTLRGWQVDVDGKAIDAFAVRKGPGGRAP